MFLKTDEGLSLAPETGELAASPRVSSPAQLKQQDVWLSAAAAAAGCTPQHLVFRVSCPLGNAGAALKSLLSQGKT